MKRRSCPCGSKFGRCEIINGRGVITCECGLILNDGAICGPEDLPDKHLKHTREQRRVYSLKGGYTTARLRGN